jgi:FkbM family methyltransferase
MERENKHSARDRLERTAHDLLYGTAVFFPVRSFYQRLFNRPKQAHRRKMRDFYEPFVRRGDLVFDVGANVGVYSELFSEMGARVVAVEPNPRCCENLRRLARGCPVYVEECAVGDAPGRANLRICEQSTISTLSNCWYEKSQQSPLHRGANWLGDLEVDIITLDQLAARYGVPTFVKIDVEGYEDHVLRGMSFQPLALTFEFIRWVPEVAMRCLGTAALAGRYRFNYMPGMEMRLAWESWVSAEELRENLDAITGDDEYGDVLARRIG